MFEPELNPRSLISVVEIDLCQFDEDSRKKLDAKLERYLKFLPRPERAIYEYTRDQKLAFKTPALVPRTNPDRKNVLLLFGNPSTYSVSMDMFFPYEHINGDHKWREHRLWRSLSEAGIVRFHKELPAPNPKNIEELNTYKKIALQDGDFYGNFNLFLRPYFSFPTPASGKYAGVAGIRSIFPAEIFRGLLAFEAARFEEFITIHNVNNVICFSQAVYDEVKKMKFPQLNLFQVGPTGRIRTTKGLQQLTKITEALSIKPRW